MLAALAALLGWFAWNAAQNLAARGIASGFAFLWREAGFEIGETSMLAYDAGHTYLRALVIGLANTFRVALAGTFNGWSRDANPMTRGEDGVWRAKIKVHEGIHHYKFVEDDNNWITDPAGGGDKGVRFTMGEITLDLGLELTGTKGVNGGLRWSVISLGGKKESGRKATHVVTVKLTPGKPGGGDVEVGDRE